MWLSPLKAAVYAIVTWSRGCRRKAHIIYRLASNLVSTVLGMFNPTGLSLHYI